MPAVDTLLGLVGLATRDQLQHAEDRKRRWHGLVRDVFAQYYLKFRECSLDFMPELPLRYSADWERHIRDELDRFQSLDLEAVGELLDAAGFGTAKWERLQKTGFPALRRLMDQVARGEAAIVGGNGGHVSAEAIEAAASEDLRDLLYRYPGLAGEIVRRIDLDTGRLRITEKDVESSEPYARLLADLGEARRELRRFRRGGQRALDRIGQLEAQLGLGRDQGNGHLDLDEERELAGLRKQLRAREASAEALRARVEELTAQLERAPRDPDEALQARLAQVEAELAERDATVVRLQQRVEAYQEDLEGRDPVVADESEELRQLRADLKARDHAIEGLRQELERARQAEASPQGLAESPAREQELLHGLRSDLQAREHAIESLRAELARLEERLAEAGQAGPQPAGQEDPEGQLHQLRNDLKVRDHTIEGLRQEVARLEADAQRAATRARGDGDGRSAPTPASVPPRPVAADRQQQAELESLRRDLKAREHMIQALRAQLQTFEQELGRARDQLVAEVRKLAALTAGDIQLKPSAELEAMDSEALLTYARDVAEDLDVRRQTLTEGLQGIDSVRGSYDESRRLFEQQQQDMDRQLERLRSEVETYRTQGDGGEGTDDLKATIGKQRQQLELLSTRVRQLVGTNKDLNDSNKKMYESLEGAVKKVIPLRRQVEELESLQEALQRYIRNKHDRTFTMRLLRESGIR